MRGGKRIGAGRKGLGPSKAYWLPIAIEGKIMDILNEYKAGLNPPETAFDSLRISKKPVSPISPTLNEEQLKKLRNWLIDCDQAKGMTEARKMTENPRLCRESFLNCIKIYEANEDMEDICELYAFD